MTDLTRVRARLTEEFDALLARHRVPGASVAVFADDEIITHSAGVLNLATGVPVTDDSLFQIGSITKIWTATLVMQLVDEGRIELDDPVRRHLPEFRLADADATETITVRHLLTHTGGFEGDVFDDTGDNDDAVELFVAQRLPGCRQPLPPGTMFSYNNVGFVVLGRLVERLRGCRWDRALRERIAEPLGGTTAATAKEAILRRAALGHISATVDGPWRPAPIWGLPRSNGPAGAMLSMSAADLIRFARLHLDDGVTADGTRLLSADSARLMRRAVVDVPRRNLWQSRQGLGWALEDWPTGQVVGHDGNTLGQSAYLRLLPERRTAVALLTNGGATDRLYRDVFGQVLETVCGATVPAAPQAPEPRPVADPHRYTGIYQSRPTRFEVTADGGALWLTVTERGDLAEAADSTEPQRFRLLRLEDDIFYGIDDDGDVAHRMVFTGFGADSRAGFLHQHRANPRIG